MTDRSVIAPMAVAASVAAVFFILVVTMLIVVLSWNKWYEMVQRRRGRVKMPREYWERKKLRAKGGVARGSVRSQVTTRDNRTSGAGNQPAYNNPNTPQQIALDTFMMPQHATLFSEVSIVPGSVRKLKIEEIPEPEGIPEPDYDTVDRSNDKVVEETLQTLKLDPDESVTPL